MSVIVAKNNGGMFGGMGNMLSTAGMFIPGAQWLVPLGMGMNAVDSMQSGDYQGALGQTLGGLMNGGWLNPAAGNVAAQPGDATAVLNEFRKIRGGF